jgi:CubicO group peptidase (beta-lactamase class C family)
VTDRPLDNGKVDALLERAQRDIDDGVLPSCQLAIARDGEVLVDETFGKASPDSRYVIFSATKPTVAAAVWQLLDAGELRLDQRVAEVLPEFATNGKDVITLEQVMLHTSGFPMAPLGPGQWETREGRLEAFAKWRLNWEPGTRFEYHPTSAHWVLAELIARVTGVDHREFVRDRVLTPLGLTRLRVGVPEDQQRDINELVSVGAPPTPDELVAAIGVRELPLSEVTEAALLQFNRPDVRAIGVPGGGAVSTAADLARFYQALLAGGHGLWSADALRMFTADVRNTFPDLYGVPANRALGMVVAGDDGLSNRRGMGSTVSPRTFGHNGAGGQIAWADPETGVSFVYLTNGLDQHVLREWRRTAGIASRAGVVAG